MSTAVRVISLVDSPRRQSFHAPSAVLGMNWSFFDASTGLVEGLRYDPKLNRRHLNRLLSPAEIGCYGSHVRLWRDLAGSTSCTQMIVLEDDMYADWGYLAALSQVDWHSLGVHYIKFYTKYPAKFRIVRWHHPMQDRHLVQFTTPALGAGAYLVTRSAAARFEQLSRVVSRPVDLMMDRPWETRVPVLGLVPYVAMELSLPSSISKRDELPATRAQRFDYLRNRILEEIKVRLYPILSRVPRVADPRVRPANPALE